MALTQLDVAKEALAQVGTRSKITSLSDGSAEAQYVSLLYAPLRDFLLVEGDYDFANIVNGLTPASPAPPLPWLQAYAYPTDCLRIRQLIPVDFVANDPRPIEWNTALQAGVKRIWTRVGIERGVYTTQAAEAVWDPLFQQAFVRLLASALAFALENRIEASKQKLEESLSFAGIANLRDAG